MEKQDVLEQLITFSNYFGEFLDCSERKEEIDRGIIEVVA
jgi:hypothetical protein